MTLCVAVCGEGRWDRQTTKEENKETRLIGEERKRATRRRNERVLDRNRMFYPKVKSCIRKKNM